MMRGDLDDRVAVGVETGRLDVHEHDLVLEAEDRIARALGQRGVCLATSGSVPGTMSRVSSVQSIRTD